MSEEQKTREQMFNDDLANSCMGLFTAFTKRGFTDDQAIQLTCSATNYAIARAQAMDSQRQLKKSRDARIEARRKRNEKAVQNGGEVNENLSR